MSGTVPTQAPAPRPTRVDTRAVALDVAVTAVWFLVLGLVAGVVWRLVTDLPVATRVQGAVGLEADQVGLQAGLDGWFFVIAAVGGLLSGIALLAWRGRDPVLMVVLVTLGGGLASYVARVTGHLLGPESALDSLRGKADGAHAPVALELHAPGVLWVLPTAAALGALVHLWVLRRPDPR